MIFSAFCKTGEWTSTWFEIPPSNWDDCLPNNHHLKSVGLLGLMQAQLPDIEHRFVQVFRGETIIGQLYFQFLTLRPYHIKVSNESENLSDHLSRLLNKLQPQIMVCGNLFRIDWPGYWFHGELNQEIKGEIMEAVWHHWRYKKHVVAMLIKDVDAHLPGYIVKKHRFKRFGEDQTMELTLNTDWHVFDDYLKSLTRKYRQRANKILEATKQVVEKEWSYEEMLLQSAVIEDLYHQVADRQTFKLGLINAAYFTGLKAKLKDRFRMISLSLHGKVVGFYSIIEYPEKNHMEMHYIGFDTEVNKTVPLYFTMLFRGVEEAIKKHVATLELGRTARDPKASLGAKPRQIENYIRLRRGLVSGVFQLADRYFIRKMDEAWVDRNPFKPITPQ